MAQSNFFCLKLNCIITIREQVTTKKFKKNKEKTINKALKSLLKMTYEK